MYTSAVKYTAVVLTEVNREELDIDANLPAGLIIVQTVIMPRVVAVITAEMFANNYKSII